MHDDAQPVIHMKIPIAIRPLVKKELNKMVSMSLIKKVEELKDWVLSLACAWKANGNL